MKHLFLNRWMALVWSAGIVWLALDIANPGERDPAGNQVTTDVTGAEVSNEQVDQVESIIAVL